MKKILIIFVVFLLSSCEANHALEEQKVIVNEVNDDAKQVDFRGKKLTIDHSLFKLSGANGNYYDQESYGVLYGFEQGNIEAIESILEEIFTNLSFWNPSRYLTETEYTVLEDSNLEDSRTLLVKINSAKDKYMKINLWETNSINYLLVIGRSQEEVNKVYNEILN